MTIAQKETISQEIARRAAQSSQAKIAKQCGISTASVSQMINRNWDHVSAEMWRKVQATLHIQPSWHTAQIGNYELLQQLLNMSKKQSISIAISDDAGKGKTHTYREFEKNNPNVIYVECKNYWTKKSYIRQLLINAGLDSLGTTEEMINRFMDHMKSLDAPLLIIDQFDKLKDPQLDLFMDFYNDLFGHCGFVISGVKALEKRILKGVNKQKIGYAELYSRIGRKFIQLDPVSLEDVKAICLANGVTETESVQYIYANSEGDLRRVKRDIEIQQIRNQRNENNLQTE